MLIGSGAVDGRSTGYKPQSKEQAPRKTRTDEMASRFEERIESYVEQQLENAFSGGRPQIPTKLALGGLGIAFASILMMVAVVVVIVLVVKVLFF